MINVPCMCPSMMLIATATANMPVSIQNRSMISTIPVCTDLSLVESSTTTQVLWVCPIVDSWSSLPHVYSQVNWDCYDYEPKCYVWTHTSTYGNCGAVLGDLYAVEKIGGARFRCPGYFINHLVISIPGPHRWLRKFFQTQNGASPLRLCQQPPYCVHRVYRVHRA